MENRLDVSRQLLTSELSAINAATAQIIILTSDIHQQRFDSNRRTSEYNHSLGAAISTITNNLNELCKEMDLYTTLINDKTHLMEQTTRLCTIFNDLLTHIETLSDNQSDASTRQNLLVTASRLGEISQDIVRRINQEAIINPFDVSVQYQDRLLSLAKSVANSTASYVLKAKDVATNVPEQENVNEIISTATQCALATSQLVACTKVKAETNDERSDWLTIVFRSSPRRFPVPCVKNNWSNPLEVLVVRSKIFCVHVHHRSLPINSTWNWLMQRALYGRIWMNFFFILN